MTPEAKAAIACGGRGWAVIPLHSIERGRCTCRKVACTSPGKHPRNVHGVSEATTDEATVWSWWARWPRANIGIATGARSGVIVLDVDPRHGGDESLARLIEEHGDLPHTVESLTGGGGRHLLFDHPGQTVKNMVGLEPGLDVRGDGGYIAAPPSVHVTGREYAWELDHHPDDVQVAALPQWLLSRLDGSSPRPMLSRHHGLLVQTMRDRRCFPQQETLRRALESQEGRELVVEGRKQEIVRMVEGAYRKPAGTEEFHLTDLGNAQRFVQLYGDIVRYVHPWRKWLLWAGTHWQKDDTAEVMRLVKQIPPVIYTWASEIKDEDFRKKVVRHALLTENDKRLRAIVNLAQSEAEVAITDEVLDIDPWLLNVQNGTLDLRTCELRSYRPEDYLTHILPVPYDPEASCQLWLRFLSRVLDIDDNLHAFLQRAVGYSLTGSTREQCFFLLHGTGANGKSTFLEVIRSLLGDLAQSARFESFLVKRGDSIPNDIARMRGARFVTAIEAEGERRLSEATIKSLTGGDTVTARFMRAEFFDFRPMFKLWLAANRRPLIRGTDLAIWRRVKLIPFTVTIPEAERDVDLAEKLGEELPGILAWAVEGFRRWLQDGLGTCEAVAAHTRAYREEQDTLRQFLEEECVLGPGRTVKKRDLYERYRGWAEKNGDRPLAHKTFSLRLRERSEGITEKRVHGGVRWWSGIDLGDVNLLEGDR